jgi:hypothetical protein
MHTPCQCPFLQKIRQLPAKERLAAAEYVARGRQQTPEEMHPAEAQRYFFVVAARQLAMGVGRTALARQSPFQTVDRKQGEYE